MGHSTTSSATGNGTAPSYLIVCFRYIGDVLVTTPLALSIKTARPEAVVDYLVFEGTEAVLAKNPHVRTVHTVPNRGAALGKMLSLFRKYDVAIAAYPSDRTAIAAAIAGRYSVGLTNGWRKEWWKHLILSMHYVCYDYLHVVRTMLMPLRMLGVEPVPRVTVGFDDADLRVAQELVSARRYVVLHPYSRNRLKCWPAGHWGRLATLIAEQAEAVPLFTVTPDPADGEYLQTILETAPQTAEVLQRPCNLNQLAAIISGAVAYVGIDTLVTHVAAAVGVPTVAIFGPSWTRYWAPWPAGCEEFSPYVANRGVQRSGNVTVIQKEWECVPCNKEYCRIGNGNGFECLEAIEPDEVFQALVPETKVRNARRERT